MSPEFSAFLSANGTLLVIVFGVLGAVGLVQWRKVRVAEQEQEFKQALLDKGVPPADIEKAVAAKPRGRRGLLEQFAGLSGGAKAGIIIGGVIIFTVGTGCIGGAIHSVAFWSHVREQQAFAPPQPAREIPPPVVPLVEKSDAITGHAFYLDLQPVTNQKLTDVVDKKGYSLASFPQKRREFGGVPFQVGPGYVRLKGNNQKNLPLEVTGINVGFKFDKLHLLHGTEFGAFANATHRVPEGTEIGHFRVGYADETEGAIPVVYGLDVRDVWNWDRSRAVTRGRVVWTGLAPAASKEGVTLRMYLTTWENPRPGDEVTSIDFVSAGNTAASPICIAMTAERAAK
jgi:hypothetical protein